MFSKVTRLTATNSVYTAFFADLERRIQQGENPTCFARGMADLGEKYGFDKAQTYFAAGSIVEAGSDTTRNQINLMLAAAAKYPAWVIKAQKQLDEVCGKASRLPTFGVSSCWVDSDLATDGTLGLGSTAIHYSSGQGKPSMETKHDSFWCPSRTD